MPYAIDWQDSGFLCGTKVQHTRLETPDLQTLNPHPSFLILHPFILNQVTMKLFTELANGPVGPSIAKELYDIVPVLSELMWASDDEVMIHTHVCSLCDEIHLPNDFGAREMISALDLDWLLVLIHRTVWGVARCRNQDH